MTPRRRNLRSPRERTIELATATTSRNGSSATRRLFAPINRELEQVDEVLRRELQSRYDFVDELVKYGLMLGGKRLRPALLLLCAKAAGRVSDSHIVLGAVVEMIHTATLVHDDVLDEADMRRQIASVHSRWGVEASVLLGDYLFTHAFYLASTLDSTLACQVIGRATNKVCEGELRQIHASGCFDLTEQQYLEIIGAKTAALCACSCRLGALSAGADNDVTEQMHRYGYDLGVAFQIADDLLDLVGDEAAVGKSLGADLQKQKPTLSVIYALEQASPAERQEMIDVLTSHNPADAMRQIAPWLARFEAIDYARHRGLEFAQSARQRLDALAPSPARAALEALTEFVVAREA